MNKLFFLSVFFLPVISLHAQEVFVCRQAVVSFFSSAPIEDIAASTNEGFFAINVKNKEVYFKVLVNTFQFRKSLMRQHFNDTYLETDQFPYAEFKGTVLRNINLRNKSPQMVEVQGNLTLHGITKPYKVSGILTMIEDRMQATAEFTIRLADHHIKIPSLLFKNIAESVNVKINAVAVPSQ